MTQSFCKGGAGTTFPSAPACCLSKRFCAPAGRALELSRVFLCYLHTETLRRYLATPAQAIPSCPAPKLFRQGKHGLAHDAATPPSAFSWLWPHTCGEGNVVRGSSPSHAAWLLPTTRTHTFQLLIPLPSHSSSMSANTAR